MKSLAKPKPFQKNKRQPSVIYGKYLGRTSTRAGESAEWAARTRCSAKCSLLSNHRPSNQRHTPRRWTNEAPNCRRVGHDVSSVMLVWPIPMLEPKPRNAKHGIGNKQPGRFLHPHSNQLRTAKCTGFSGEISLTKRNSRYRIRKLTRRINNSLTGNERCHCFIFNNDESLIECITTLASSRKLTIFRMSRPHR